MKPQEGIDITVCHTCPTWVRDPMAEKWLATRSDAALRVVLPESEVTDEDVWLCLECGARASLGELCRRGKLGLIADALNERLWRDDA